jgi:hypothetical protein
MLYNSDYHFIYVCIQYILTFRSKNSFIIKFRIKFKLYINFTSQIPFIPEVVNDENNETFLYKSKFI